MSPVPETNLEARFAEIEAKLSLTEDLLEQLNRTVFRQQERIDLLQRELQVLYRQVREAMPPESRNPADEVPPHY
jgi:SlyX protein